MRELFFIEFCRKASLESARRPETVKKLFRVDIQLGKLQTSQNIYSQEQATWLLLLLCSSWLHFTNYFWYVQNCRAYYTRKERFYSLCKEKRKQNNIFCLKEASTNKINGDPVLERCSRENLLWKSHINPKIVLLQLLIYIIIVASISFAFWGLPVIAGQYFVHSLIGHISGTKHFWGIAFRWLLIRWNSSFQQY